MLLPLNFKIDNTTPLNTALISASFVGCIEDEVEDTTEEGITQQDNENEVTFYVTQDSNNVYYVDILKVKEPVDLTNLTLSNLIISD